MKTGLRAACLLSLFLVLGACPTDDDDDSSPTIMDDDDSGEEPPGPCVGSLVGEFEMEETGSRILGVDAPDKFGGRASAVLDVTDNGSLDFAIGADGANLAAGATYVFDGASPLPDSAGGAGVVLSGANEYSWTTGPTASRGGDVNGDGIQDLLVVEPGISSFGEPEGVVRLVLGPLTADMSLGDAQASFWPPPIPNSSACQNLLVSQRDDMPSAAGGADVDGDGLDDVVVGGWRQDAEYGIGKAYVFSGPLSGDIAPEMATATISGVEPCVLTGWPVLVTDLNGDGLGDVVLGETINGGSTWTGAVYGFLGPLAGDYTTDDADWQLVGEPLERAGWTIVATDDLTGDDVPDILVTVDGREDHWQMGVYIVPGPLAGVHDLLDIGIRLDGTYVGGAYPKQAIATDGDFNGDGASDLLVGEYWWSDPSTSATGIAYVEYGPITEPRDLATADLRLLGPDNTFSYAGQSVAFIPDLDGDGTNELLVGAPSYTTEDGSRTGAAFVVYGQPCTAR